MSRSILVFSYYTNIPGACQAEWVDDRILGFIGRGYNISLLSGTCCFTHTDPHISHRKIFALSPHSASYEYEAIRRGNIPIKKRSFTYIYLYVMHRVNKVLKALSLSSGEGRWTWSLPALFTALGMGAIRSSDFVYTTGGPPSAHIAGILIAKLFRKKVICEFQDPLSGDDIGRNSLSKIGLSFFEKQIIRFADCTIYCTRNAMINARKRYKTDSHKIFYVYPGSNAVEKFVGQSNDYLSNRKHNKKINIGYLGSLYQTRNFDTLMQAIDELIKEGDERIKDIAINVYGGMNQDIRERIIAFQHPGIIWLHGLISREEAMHKAMEADILLLVQNTDQRSVATIPFKTYDYLHSGKLVLALVYRNDEIEKMMLEHGHLVCQADDVPGIKNAIKKITAGISAYTGSIKISNYTPDFAVQKMLELIDNTSSKTEGNSAKK